MHATHQGQNRRKGDELMPLGKDTENAKQNRQTLAMLQILALGNRQIELGKTQPAADVIKRLRGGRDVDVRR